jgi:hypothetical protein
MSETTDAIEQKYHEVFEAEMTVLKRRREHDPSCTIEDISGILQNLYINDGNNWTGRSEIVQASIDATIAAYEHFIHEWKKETVQ